MNTTSTDPRIPLVPINNSHSSDCFHPSGPTREEQVGTHFVETAPLMFDKQFDLLTLSQNYLMLGDGTIDNSDSIDPDISLKAFYLEIDGAVHQISVEGSHGTEFKPLTMSGKDLISSALILKFYNRNVAFKLGDINVEAHVNIAGTCIPELGTVVLKVTKFKVVSINGQHRDVDILPINISDIVDKIDAGGLVGYDLKAYRVNYNRRTRYQIPPALLSESVSELGLATSEDSCVAVSDNELKSTKSIHEFMTTLAAIMVNDPEYLWSWHCNIVMANMDAGGNKETAMEGSARFLQILCGVDIRQNPHYVQDLANIETYKQAAELLKPKRGSTSCIFQIDEAAFFKEGPGHTVSDLFKSGE